MSEVMAVRYETAAATAMDALFLFILFALALGSGSVGE